MPDTMNNLKLKGTAENEYATVKIAEGTYSTNNIQEETIEVNETEKEIKLYVKSRKWRHQRIHNSNKKGNRLKSRKHQSK